MTESASAAVRRVGLFGGSFDPVHRAHLALAHEAMHALRLDEVRWVPTGQPWQKSRSITPALHREHMLQLATAGEPRFCIDRIELLREGPSYTLDTVRAFSAAEPEAEWFLLIGADQYANLHTWTDWRELLARVTLAVANRPGAAPPVNAEVLRHPHRTVPLAMLDISSTQVRQRVAAGQDISQLVPPEVARYIDQHRLYRADPGS